MIDRRVLVGGFAAGVVIGTALIAGSSWQLTNPSPSHSNQAVTAAQQEAELNRGIQLLLSHQYPAALQIIRPRALAGNATAEYELGAMYSQGAGLPLDRSQAVHWVQLAANQGQLKAMKALAQTYSRGLEGVPVDSVMARTWTARAAAAGDRDSQRQLGSMLLFGDGGPADEPQAEYWLGKAAAAGDSLAAAGLQALSGLRFRQQLAMWILQRRMQPIPMPGMARENDPAGSMLQNIMPSVPANPYSSGMYEPFDTGSSPLASEPVGIDRSAGAIDSRTGQYLASDGASGYIDPRTGTHYTQIDPNGAINDRTGSYASISH